MSKTTLAKSNGNSPANTAERHDFWRPWYNVEKSEEAHILHVAMPGVPKSGINVALDGDLLTITGHRTNPVPESWKPISTEMGHREYRLSLRLNLDVEEDKIKATVEDGMLRLTLPVKEEAKPRQIPIN